MKITRCVLLIGLLALAACERAKYSEIPNITFKALIPDSVRAGSSEDTAILAFTVRDGDGDLGNQSVNGEYDIYLKDSRDSTITGYFFPQIPGGVIDPKQGLEGDCFLALYAAGLIPRQDSIHKRNGDTVRYEVYIKDQAGHESNRFTTPDLFIKP